MKVFFSYWSQGYARAPSPFVVDLHRLSAHLAKRAYGNAHLVTDTIGARSLGGLGFDSVSTELDALDKKFSPVWSLGKIWTYANKPSAEDSFLHLDFDVLLWKPLPEIVSSAPIFAERVEMEVRERYGLERFFAQCPAPHELSSAGNLDGAINAGIVGGSDHEFLRRAAQSALDFVFNGANEETMTAKNIEGVPSWGRATIAEQLFFYHFARINRKEIVYLLNDAIDRDKDKEAARLGYTHLWGMKNSAWAQSRVREHCKKFGLEVSSEPKNWRALASAEEQAIRKAKCANCEWNQVGYCAACRKCGGIPRKIETRITIAGAECPLPEPGKKWRADPTAPQTAANDFSATGRKIEGGIWGNPLMQGRALKRI